MIMILHNVNLERTCLGVLNFLYIVAKNLILNYRQQQLGSNTEPLLGQHNAAMTVGTSTKSNAFS